MPSYRTRHSATLRDFCSELDRLERFDAANQEDFSTSGRVTGVRRLSQRQLHLLTEVPSLPRSARMRVSCATSSCCTVWRNDLRQEPKPSPSSNQRISITRSYSSSHLSHSWIGPDPTM